MDLTVRLGGWEHACCGAAIELNNVVDLTCTRSVSHDGTVTLFEVRHGADFDLRVRGRVKDILVVRDDGQAEAVARVPSGQAISGNDPCDDGHLEKPWTGERVPDGGEFLVVVESSKP